MADVLENWVKLVPGIEKKMRFSGGSVQQRQIEDPVTRGQKTIRGLIMRVTHEDGMPVQKDFSIVSERLAGEMSAYLTPERLAGFEFTFLKEPGQFTAPRLVRIAPVS